MKRALRLDKIRLAALEATLKLYRDPDRLAETLPTLRFFVRPKAEIAAGARELALSATRCSGRRRLRVSMIADCTSQIGSGALPLETLPSAGLAIAPVAREGRRRPARGAGGGVPRLPIPVIGRIKEGALISRPALPR